MIGRLRAAGCVFAEDEAALLTEAAASPDQLAALVGRRVEGVPLEYVLGWAEFCGLRIVVDQGVFVPRRRTELLAREAAARLPSRGIAVELCCGAGAVAATLLHGAPGGDVHAADVDAAAVRCARRNLEPLGGRVYCGDLDAPLPDRLRGRVDVLVANAPYVPTEAIALMPPEARDHEPMLALDGGPDGLAVLRRVIAVAPTWLAPGGAVLVEASERQVTPLMAALRTHGLSAAVVSDEEIAATVVVGRNPG